MAETVTLKSGLKPHKSRLKKEVKFQGCNSSAKGTKRPYSVVRDFQRLHRSKRVSQLLENSNFVEELEGILKGQKESSHGPKLRRPEADSSVIPAPPPPPPMHQGSPQSSLAGRPLTHPQGIIPVNDLRGSLSSKYSVKEKQARCKLASLYRLLDVFGWNSGVYGHLSCRVPGEPNHLLLNPFGLLPSEITASNLVKIDQAGSIIDPGTTQYGANSAGISIHATILQSRPEINCVCHVHGKAVVAVSSMKCGLLPISQESTLMGGISYHDYHGIAEENERESIARDLGKDNKVLLLRNHGVAVLGTTVEEAFGHLQNTIEACEIQVASLSAGLANLIEFSSDVAAKNAELVRNGGGGVSKLVTFGVGELEFEAYMRRFDSQGYNTGYVYKGKQLQQSSKTTVKVHLTADEKKIKQEAVRTAKARAEARTARRGVSSDSSPKKIDSSKDLLATKLPEKQANEKSPARTIGAAQKSKRQDEEDDWAFIGHNSHHPSQCNGDGQAAIRSTGHTRQKAKFEKTEGESAFDRAKRTAEKVAKSTEQVAVAQNVHPAEDRNAEVIPANELPGLTTTSFQRTKQTAQEVAESTTQAVSRLPSDTAPPITTTSNLEEGQMNVVGNDSSTGLEVESKASLGTKVQTWLDEAGVEDGLQNGTAVERMKITAEQVAESTSAAVEKLTL